MKAEAQMKLTAKDREQWSELRHGWISFVLLLVLFFTPLTVGKNAGQQLEVFARLVALILWLVVRPWRFGLLAAHSRKTIRLQGFVILSLFALVAFIKLLR